MDRITFDFETGEITFDCDAQKGVEIDVNLKQKREAIMAAAGYETIKMSDLAKEVNAICRQAGLPPLMSELESSERNDKK